MKIIPKKDYLLSNYLNNNEIYSSYYHVDRFRNRDIFCFDLNGGRRLNLTFEKEFLSMLPNDFVNVFDRKRRKDFLPRCLADERK